MSEAATTSRVRGVVKSWYNGTVRDALPRKLGQYNGVVARQPRLLDATDHIPDYKQTLMSHVQDVVEPDDRVVVIGGGKGIASVIAAEAAGPEGSVVTYEAGEAQADICRGTMELNDVAETSSVVAGLVGPAKDVYGDDIAQQIPVSDLPPHDTMIMDCEGAEREIIPRLADLEEAAPDRVVVETHEMFDAPLEAIVDELESAGYEPEEANRTKRVEGNPNDWICTASTASADDRRCEE